MSAQDFESGLGSIGRSILAELRAAERENPALLRLKEEAAWAVICFKGDDMDVELVQMWGGMGESPSRLESRLQFITKKVYLDNGERNRITFLLQQAKFKPVPGQHGSFSLDFGEGPEAPALDKASLARLRETVVEMAKITKAARQRSWK